MEEARNKSTLLIVAVPCLAGMALGSALTLALTQRSQSIPTSGVIIGICVSVYADVACGQNLTDITLNMQHRVGIHQH